MSSITNKPRKIFGSHHHSIKEREQKIVVDFIKSLIAEYYSGEFLFKEISCLKSFIQSRVTITYTHVAAWFILSEEKTIVHYATIVRINKVKELLVYTDLSLETIAGKLDYLSTKIMEEELMKQTGLSTDYFRELRRQKERLALRQRLRGVN